MKPVCWKQQLDALLSSRLAGFRTSSAGFGGRRQLLGEPKKSSMPCAQFRIEDVGKIQRYGLLSMHMRWTGM